MSTLKSTSEQGDYADTECCWNLYISHESADNVLFDLVCMHVCLLHKKVIEI